MTEKRRRPNAITKQMILAQRFFSLYLCFCLLFSKLFSKEEEEAYGESLRVQDPHSIHSIFSMSSSVDKSIRNLTEECETRLKHGCSVKKELWFIRDKFLIFQRIHSKSCPCRIFWQYSEVLLNICEVKSLCERSFHRHKGHNLFSTLVFGRREESRFQSRFFLFRQNAKKKEKAGLTCKRFC